MQIRVHELASELGVSTQQVLSFLEERGQRVRGPSAVVGASVAAKVRSRFRTARAGGVAPVTSAPVRSAPMVAAAVAATAPTLLTTAAAPSLFLPPVSLPAASPIRPVAAAPADPFAIPGAGPAFRAGAPRPAATPPRQREPQRVPTPEPSAPQENMDDLWRRRDFDQAAQQIWCDHGIRPQDAALADRCRSTGISPSDLPRKLSGRTVLQRLRDGESTTSVWARIQEAEQQPRRAGTKLTGRFQLS